MKLKNILRLIIAIVFCNLAGFIGSFFTLTSIGSWYSTIDKPVFNPPNWIFGPVWTLLFILMGISLYFIWEAGLKKKNVKLPLLFFGVQLILNIFWSVFFFGLQNPLLAFIEIVILWIFILLTIISFSKVSRTAAYLLIPYILWVSFAAALNFSIFLLN